MNRIISSSLIIQGGNYIYKLCCTLNQRFCSIYHYSNTHRLINIFRERIKIYSRHSLPGKLTEINETTLIDLSSSRMIQRLTHFNQKLKLKKLHYLGSSSVLSLIKREKKKPIFSSVRKISIIAIITITINVVFSFVLNKQIGLWGWLMRGVFLFLAITGLFCRASLSTAIKSSLLLKKLRID